ncbi:MAG: hypothetical protein HUJ74_04245 [Lachnospiraceae bacterium]|nr:hypothetical protein [Lachnospiraceae bacterium]
MTKNKKKRQKKDEGELDFLYKLVDEHPLANWKIIGVLSAEGLKKQYEFEKNNKEHTEIKPSISKSQLQEIINKHYNTEGEKTI